MVAQRESVRRQRRVEIALALERQRLIQVIETLGLEVHRPTCRPACGSTRTFDAQTGERRVVKRRRSKRAEAEVRFRAKHNSAAQGVQRRFSHVTAWKHGSGAGSAYSVQRRGLA